MAPNRMQKGMEIIGMVYLNKREKCMNGDKEGGGFGKEYRTSLKIFFEAL